MLVFSQVRPPDHQQKVGELLTRVRTEADIAIGGRLDRRRLDRLSREGRIRRIVGAPVHQPIHRVAVVRTREVDRLEDRQIHMLTLPAGTRPQDGRQTCNRAERPRYPFANPPARLKGRSPNQSAHGDRPPLGLKRELRGEPIGPGSRQAVGCNRKHDECRMATAKSGDVESFAGVRFKTMSLDHQIGLGEQRLDVRVGCGADYGLLACIQELEECGIVAAEVCIRRRPSSQRITRRRLDLDDRRAGVCE
jgi:hypothetical protein